MAGFLHELAFGPLVAGRSMPQAVLS
jgi:hypothetical protein